MHDVKYFIENTDEVKKNLEKRNFDVAIIDDILNLNIERKKLLQFVESKRGEIKKLSREVGLLKKDKKDASSLMNQVSTIKLEVELKSKELEGVEKKEKDFLSVIPNLLAEDVPAGSTENDNIEIEKRGKTPDFSFEAKDHVDLGEQLGMLDFESGAKITGSRFVVYKKHLAKLERVLINFMIEEHIKNGYEEIIPPFIVNENSMFGTGQLPKFEDDLFKLISKDKDKHWYLVPTAEVPLTNLRKGELFAHKELPLKYVAYTPCFRSEAGSYGKDTRGLIRLHQFNKVEMVNIVPAADADKFHEEMVNSAASILDLLELPYRKMNLCGGDTGFSAKKCVDIEVWLPAQKKYREISSISNCGDFQSRRASIRFRNEQGRPEFPYTLNGSGLAVGRTLVAIMENNQQDDGSIKVPKVLVPYMGGMEIIKK